MLSDSVQFIENSFWSTDKTALNILLDKLEKSNKTTNAIQLYFNQRAQIEEEYGNHLLKLAESFLSSTQHKEDDVFDIISNTTEMSARAHVDLSQNIRNLLESPLNDYVHEQENIKTFMTNHMKESQNLKLLHGDNVKKTRQMYINECQKANPSIKDIEVLDFEYQKAINLMQANSHSWIRDWRESCKTYQSLEVNRLEYLKAIIKTFSTMTACTYSIDDQTCERLANVMDDINVDYEISKFIANHRTGSILPEIPKYTKYKRDSFRENTTLTDESSTCTNPLKSSRTIKEINIPIIHDEELRSVNDQLKKIPSPWDNTTNNKPRTSLYPPQKYPLDPIYKLDRKHPTQSDSILNTYAFQQEEKAVAVQSKSNNLSTLIPPNENKSYHQHFPWNSNKEPTKHLSTTTHKKSSALFSPLGFLKKKKVVAEVETKKNGAINGTCIH